MQLVIFKNRFERYRLSALNQFILQTDLLKKWSIHLILERALFYQDVFH